MRITALGTQGWFASTKRLGLCVAVEEKRNLFILDAGTGIASLLEPQHRHLLNDYAQIHILLSHFHLDHVIGLSYLPAILADHHKVHIHGPGAVTGRNTKEVLEQILRPPYFSLPLESWPWLDGISELQVGLHQIGRTTVSTRIQNHPGSSLGFVINKKFAYITDTAVDPATASFVEGCKLVFHECWFPEETYSTTHSHLPGIHKIFGNATVEQIGLIHKNPTTSEQEYHDALSKLEFSTTKVTLVNDNDCFEI